MSTLTSLIASLKGSGITGAALSSAIAAVASASPTSAIQAACTVILANSGNPQVIKDETTKLAEIPNLPIAVANLLPTLQAAATPLEVVQAVQAIETALGQSSSGLGLNLGSLL